MFSLLTTTTMMSTVTSECEDHMVRCVWTTWWIVINCMLRRLLIKLFIHFAKGMASDVNENPNESVNSENVRRNVNRRPLLMEWKDLKWQDKPTENIKNMWERWRKIENDEKAFLLLFKSFFFSSSPFHSFIFYFFRILRFLRFLRIHSHVNDIMILFIFVKVFKCSRWTKVSFVCRFMIFFVLENHLQYLLNFNNDFYSAQWATKWLRAIFFILNNDDLLVRLGWGHFYSVLQFSSQFITFFFC